MIYIKGIDSLRRYLEIHNPRVLHIDLRTLRRLGYPEDWKLKFFYSKEREISLCKAGLCGDILIPPTSEKLWEDMFLALDLNLMNLPPRIPEDDLNLYFRTFNMRTVFLTDEEAVLFNTDRGVISSAGSSCWSEPERLLIFKILNRRLSKIREEIL